MSNITCTRRLQFCAGHRVMGHENKCANLHGHNYVVFITAKADDLDSLGRVIDFSVIKSKVGNWIEQYWDHGMVLYEQDVETIEAIRKLDTKLYPLPYNPTAENMAKWLLFDICPRLFKDTGVVVTKIVLWETENCYAEVTL